MAHSPLEVDLTGRVAVVSGANRGCTSNQVAGTRA